MNEISERPQLHLYKQTTARCFWDLHLHQILQQYVHEQLTSNMGPNSVSPFQIRDQFQILFYILFQKINYYICFFVFKRSESPEWQYVALLFTAYIAGINIFVGWILFYCCEEVYRSRPIGCVQHLIPSDIHQSVLADFALDYVMMFRLKLALWLHLFVAYKCSFKPT
ncbi:hypothetical protein CEXT_751481 [Caerostris extrusa]|uniref:Uncharacterized protein n=1 Tax=Caerostris extrusa TaxID=172846 RepID=A0AAV4N7I6_CAEEX|nr:hypothetical protein CEXT_751481 [Caerostris extrusa]